MRLQLQDEGMIPIVLASRGHKAHKERVKEKRAAKAERQHTRHDNRMIRLKGKSAAKRAHAAKKLHRINHHHQIDTPQDGSSPGSDNSQNYSAPQDQDPQDYSAPQDQDPQDYSAPEEDQQDDSSYEQLPDEEQQDPYGQDTYAETMNDPYSLSAGVFETVFKGAKGAAGGIVNEFKKSQTKPSSHTQITSANKKDDPKVQGMSETSKMLLSGAAGTVTGFLIGKMLK